MNDRVKIAAVVCSWCGADTPITESHALPQTCQACRHSEGMPNLQQIFGDLAAAQRGYGMLDGLTFGRSP